MSFALTILMRTYTLSQSISIAVDEEAPWDVSLGGNCIAVNVRGMPSFANRSRSCSTLVGSTE